MKIGETLYAPWTDEQVEALTRYQQGGWMHPYTCGRRSEHEGEGVLIPTPAGWVCPTCEFTQDWAAAFMGDLEWVTATEKRYRDMFKNFGSAS